MLQTVQQILQNPFLTGAGGLMVLGYIGYISRTLPKKVWSVIQYWTTNVLEIRQNCPVFDAAITLISESAIETRGPRVKQLWKPDFKTNEDLKFTKVYHHGTQQIWLSASQSTFWTKICGQFCRVTLFREQPANSSGDPLALAPPVWCISIMSLFGSTKSIADEINRRHAIVQEKPHVKLFIPAQWSSYADNSMRLPFRTSKSLIHLDLYQQILQDLQSFERSEQEYLDKGLPYRHNLLFSGPPGTSKTSFIHVLASDLKRDIKIIPISSIEDDNALARMMRSSEPKSIVVIEDCTSLIEDEKIKTNSKLTFSGVLNCLDGFLTPTEGRIIILTTNHPEKLEGALTRSGRINKHWKFPLLNGKIAQEYSKRVWNVDIDEVEWEGKSPADLIQHLRQRAEP